MTNQLTHRRDFCPGTAVFIQNLFVHFAIFHVSKWLAISAQGLFSLQIHRIDSYIFTPPGCGRKIGLRIFWINVYFSLPLTARFTTVLSFPNL